MFNWFWNLFEIRRHNKRIDRAWRENGRRITASTIGWRRDPFYEQDGYVPDRATPDGTPVYTRVVEDD